MPINKNKLISFNEDIEFLEKMDYNLAYSIEELAELILGEFLPLESIDQFIKYVQPNWEHIEEEVPCSTLEEIKDNFIPYLLGFQTKRIQEYFTRFTKLMAIIQSCRIQDLIVPGIDKNGNFYYVKVYSEEYK